MLPDAAKQRQGRALLESLYSRKPPVVDIRAVMTIEAFAKERNDIDDRIDVLWSHATNARPNDDDLHRHWFKMRFWAKDWQGARKVRTHRAGAFLQPKPLLNHFSGSNGLYETFSEQTRAILLGYLREFHGVKECKDIRPGEDVVRYNGLPDVC